MALSIEKKQARQRENLSIQGRAKKISRGRAELVGLKKNSSGR